MAETWASEEGEEQKGGGDAGVAVADAEGEADAVGEAVGEYGHFHESVQKASWTKKGPLPSDMHWERCTLNSLMCSALFLYLMCCRSHYSTVLLVLLGKVFLV